MGNRFYTDEEVSQAHNTNLIEFLEMRNEKIEKVGSYYYWKYRGETISLSGNLWFNHYAQMGGEAIGFVERFFNVGFVEAVGMLLGESQYRIQERLVWTTSKKHFELPEKNERMFLVKGYLTNRRGINFDVVEAFVNRNLIYEDRKYHGVVFVGYDKMNNPRHAHIRGSGLKSKFKMTVGGSEGEYSFHWNGSDNELYLFEAPIDLLSYITLFPNNWQQHTYASACSVSDKVLYQCLSDNPQINTVHVCFDSDEAGQKAARRIVEQLVNKNYIANIIKPNQKDWNEELLGLDEYESN